MECIRQLEVFMHADVTVSPCVDPFLAGRFALFDVEISEKRPVDA